MANGTRGFGSLSSLRGQVPVQAQQVQKTDQKVQAAKEIMNSRTSQADLPVWDNNGVIIGYRRTSVEDSYLNVSSPRGTSHSGKTEYARYKRALLDEKHHQFHDELYVPFKTVIQSDLFKFFNTRNPPADDEIYFINQENCEYIGNYARMLVAYVRHYNDLNIASEKFDENFDTFTKVVISQVSRLLKRTSEEGRRGNYFNGEDVTFGFIYGISGTHNESGLAKHPANGGETWLDVYDHFLSTVGLMNTEGKYMGLPALREKKKFSQGQELFMRLHELYADISAANKAQREARGQHTQIEAGDEDFGNR